MDLSIPAAPISPLPQRLIDDMNWEECGHRRIAFQNKAAVYGLLF